MGSKISNEQRQTLLSKALEGLRFPIYCAALHLLTLDCLHTAREAAYCPYSKSVELRSYCMRKLPYHGSCTGFELALAFWLQVVNTLWDVTSKMLAMELVFVQV